MKRKSPLTILFLGKAGDAHSERARDYCARHFGKVDAHFGKWKQAMPEGVKSWEGDLIVSYLSRWLVPGAVLKRARVAAINFHPGTPDYPGIGCVNFALYDGAEEFGATCHVMEPKADTGAILGVKRCPVAPSDTVASLLERTYEKQFELFGEILDRVVKGEPLTPTGERWTRQAYTRVELDALSRLRLDMTPAEIERRARATTYREWGPHIEIGGRIYQLSAREPR